MCHLEKCDFYTTFSDMSHYTHYYDAHKYEWKHLHYFICPYVTSCDTLLHKWNMKGNTPIDML